MSKSHPTLDPFIAAASQVKGGARVLELGTLRWGKDPTHHKHWLPSARLFTMSDVQAGVDVDEVADAHDLSGVFGHNEFDAVIACSVWEHLEQPWIAAREAIKVLRPGGVIFVQTHHAFPEHGYPNDYFRFSRAALTSLFTAALATDIVTNYEFPCEIVTPEERRDNAWLNVCLFARKPW